MVVTRIVGVTGSRSLIPAHWLIVHREVKAALVPGTVVSLVHGACVGADETAAFTGSTRVHVTAIVPPNRSRVSDRAIQHSDSVILIPDGPDGYKRRNQAIVDRADVLLAFPLYPEDHPQSRRSGTHQTIRMARRKGIPVYEYVLWEVR